ncbi:unnamed protein product [Bursaphelenchus xylophilus]|uniref:(pine wood nematode) hypothetical protein n=1 Tax=Bursaphelenchus xylophilus TaxID=6326 RepID=A0A1I7SBL3_BURXY|nr:unnamed protein product [Bursaphelenchus xylophilus]CAG9114449.1 unnamed protein product [Bursaphelenchus xylophilus]
MFSSSYDDDCNNSSAFAGYNDFSFDTKVGSCWEDETNDWIKDREGDFDDYYGQKRKERETRQNYYKLGAHALDSLYGSSASSSSYDSSSSSKSSSENVSRSSSLSYSRRPSVQKEGKPDKTEKLEQIKENTVLAEVNPRIARIKPYHFEDEINAEKCGAKVIFIERKLPPYEPTFFEKVFLWCN